MANHTITVTPINVGAKLNFPTDMLRSEGAFPATPHDAVKLSVAIKKHLDPKVYSDCWIILRCFANKKWKPNLERWNSFGWQVVQHGCASGNR